jgi:ssDNA-binding Zn-finger/Zn-ribbon topoisomerase 1
MAKIKGICKNFEECDLADEKVIQEAEKSNYICEECGKPLYAVDTPKKNGIGGKVNGKLIGIIAAAVLLLGGIGFGIYSLFGGKPEPTAIKLNFTNLTMTVGEQKQLTASLLPEDVERKVTFVYTAWKDDAYKEGKEKTKIVNANNSSGMLMAMRPGSTKVKVMCKEWPKLEAFCNITVLPKPQTNESDGQGESLQTDTVKKTPEGNDKVDKKTGGTTSPKPNPTHENGTVKLSYGIYTGRLSKDGKPNGTGKLKFTQSYRLNSEYMAQPGESIEGIFENGIPKIVTYYKKDGSPIKIKTR